MTLFVILVLGMALCFIGSLMCHTVVLHDWFMVGKLTEDQIEHWYKRSRLYLILYHVLGAFLLALLIT